MCSGFNEEHENPLNSIYFVLPFGYFSCDVVFLTNVVSIDWMATNNRQYLPSAAHAVVLMRFSIDCGCWRETFHLPYICKTHRRGAGARRKTNYREQPGLNHSKHMTWLHEMVWNPSTVWLGLVCDNSGSWLEQKSTFKHQLKIWDHSQVLM